MLALWLQMPENICNSTFIDSKKKAAHVKYMLRFNCYIYNMCFSLLLSNYLMLQCLCSIIIQYRCCSSVIIENIKNNITLPYFIVSINLNNKVFFGYLCFSVEFSLKERYSVGIEFKHKLT